jgi:hypothetical protein
MKKGKNNERKWKHDCKRCVFVQSIKTVQGHYDLYVCNYSYLARFSNKPEDYMSYPDLNVLIPMLHGA